MRLLTLLFLLVKFLGGSSTENNLLSEERKTLRKQPMNIKNTTKDERSLFSIFAGFDTYSMIVGGNNANVDDYRFMALVTIIDGKGRMKCGGTLVNGNLVLTAAHCTPRTIEYSGWVVVGEYQRGKNDGNEKIYRIDDFHVHPNYDTSTGYPDNDFALLQLDNCSDISPVQLGYSAAYTSDNPEVTILGWGQNLFQGGTEKVLQEAQTKISSCSPWSGITKNMMCTSGQGVTSNELPGIPTGPCGGDSGGPLLVQGPFRKLVQVGVISFGHKCPGHSSMPSVYARVSTASEWFQDMLQDAPIC